MFLDIRTEVYFRNSFTIFSLKVVQQFYFEFPNYQNFVLYNRLKQLSLHLCTFRFRDFGLDHYNKFRKIKNKHFNKQTLQETTPKEIRPTSAKHSMHPREKLKSIHSHKPNLQYKKNNKTTFLH